MPVPSLGAVYGTRPSSLVVGKVEAGSPIWLFVIGDWLHRLVLSL